MSNKSRVPSASTRQDGVINESEREQKIILRTKLLELFDKINYYSTNPSESKGNVIPTSELKNKNRELDYFFSFIDKYVENNKIVQNRIITLADSINKLNKSGVLFKNLNDINDILNKLEKEYKENYYYKLNIAKVLYSIKNDIPIENENIDTNGIVFYTIINDKELMFDDIDAIDYDEVFREDLIKNYNGSIEKFIDRYTSMINGKFIDASNKIQSKNKEISDLKIKSNKLERELKEYKENNPSSLKTQLEECKRISNKLTTDISGLQSTCQSIESFKKQLTDLETEKKRLGEQNENFKSHIDSLKREIQSKMNLITSLSRDLELEKSTNKKNSEGILSENKTLKTRLEELNAEIKSSKELFDIQILEKNREIASLHQSNSNLTKQNSQLKSNRNIETEFNRLRQSISDEVELVNSIFVDIINASRSELGNENKFSKDELQNITIENKFQLLKNEISNYSKKIKELITINKTEKQKILNSISKFTNGKDITENNYEQILDGIKNSINDDITIICKIFGIDVDKSLPIDRRIDALKNILSTPNFINIELKQKIIETLKRHNLIDENDGETIENRINVLLSAYKIINVQRENIISMFNKDKELMKLLYPNEKSPSMDSKELIDTLTELTIKFKSCTSNKDQLLLELERLKKSDTKNKTDLNKLIAHINKLDINNEISTNEQIINEIKQIDNNIAIKLYDIYLIGTYNSIINKLSYNSNIKEFIDASKQEGIVGINLLIKIIDFLYESYDEMSKLLDSTTIKSKKKIKSKSKELKEDVELLNSNIRNKNSSIEKLKQELAELKLLKEEKINDNEELTSMIDSIKENHSEDIELLNKNIRTKNDLINYLNTKIEYLSNELIAFQSELESQKSLIAEQVEKLNDQEEYMKLLNLNLDFKLDDNDDSRNAYDHQRKLLLSKIDKYRKLEEENESLKIDIDEKNKIIDELKDEIIALNKVIEGLKIQILDLESSREESLGNIVSRMEELRIDIDKKNKLIEQMNQTIEKLEEENEKLNEKIENLLTEKQEIQEELDGIKSIKDELIKKVEEDNKDKEKLTKKIQELQSLIDSLKSKKKESVEIEKESNYKKIQEDLLQQISDLKELNDQLKQSLKNTDDELLSKESEFNEAFVELSKILAIENINVYNILELIQLVDERIKECEYRNNDIENVIKDNSTNEDAPLFNKTTLESLNEEIKRLTIEITEKDKEIEKLIQQESSKDSSLSIIKSNLETIDEEYENDEQIEIDDIEEKYEMIMSELENMNNENNELKEYIQELEDNEQILHDTLNELTEEIEYLKNELETEINEGEEEDNINDDGDDINDDEGDDIDKYDDNIDDGEEEFNDEKYMKKNKKSSVMKKIIDTSKNELTISQEEFDNLKNYYQKLNNEYLQEIEGLRKKLKQQELKRKEMSNEKIYEDKRKKIKEDDVVVSKIKLLETVRSLESYKGEVSKYKRMVELQQMNINNLVITIKDMQLRINDLNEENQKLKMEIYNKNIELQEYQRKLNDCIQKNESNRAIYEDIKRKYDAIDPSSNKEFVVLKQEYEDSKVNQLREIKRLQDMITDLKSSTEMKNLKKTSTDDVISMSESGVLASLSNRTDPVYNKSSYEQKIDEIDKMKYDLPYDPLELHIRKLEKGDEIEESDSESEDSYNEDDIENDDDDYGSDDDYDYDESDSDNESLPDKEIEHLVSKSNKNKNSKSYRPKN